MARLDPPPGGPLDFERVLVPKFKLASCPTISLSEIKSRRFDIVDRHAIIPPCAEYAVDWGEMEYVASWQS